MRKYIILLGLLPLFSACSKGSEKATDAPAPASAEERMAQGPNVANGQRVYMNCAMCHDARAEGRNRVGPNLWGIYNAKAARLDDFSYSRAMRDAELVWDEATLDAYLENPRGFLPGGRMAYDGEKDPINRRDLIAYLKTLK